MNRFILNILLLVAGTISFVASAEPRDPQSVLMIAGQSREEFSDYLVEVCDKGVQCKLPGGATFYTSLNLNGLHRPHANRAGDNHQDLWYLTKVYQPLAIQIGLWLGSHQLSDIGNGLFDREIRLLTEKLSSLDRPVFVRIGYEFDGPHNQYHPPEFVRAYQHIARYLRSDSNIRLVWHSFALQPTYQNKDIMQWYPGDDYVDWIGISFFQIDSRGYFDASNRQQLVELAREKGKPLMVAEASAIRYTDLQKRTAGKAYWEYWYQPLFDFIESTPEVKALSIINVDWNSQKQHVDLGWGDARLHADQYVLQNWRLKMKEDYWLFNGPDLYQKIESIERIKQ